MQSLVKIFPISNELGKSPGDLEMTRKPITDFMKMVTDLSFENERGFRYTSQQFLRDDY